MANLNIKSTSARFMFIAPGGCINMDSLIKTNGPDYIRVVILFPHYILGERAIEIVYWLCHMRISLIFHWFRYFLFVICFVW